MTETRIKPYQQQLAENERRARQRQIYRRNQVIGIIMLAAGILIWALFHTNPRSISPPAGGVHESFADREPRLRRTSLV